MSAKRAIALKPLTSTRMAVAYACYAILALLAAFTLDGKIRLVIFIVLAGLAVKTWIAYLRESDR